MINTHMVWLTSLLILSKGDSQRGPKYECFTWGCSGIVLFHLHGLEATHAAAAAAPHEAESLDPVVSGHGGVPHPARPYLHAASQGDWAQHDLDIW